MAENKVQYGLCNVHYAPYTITDGVVSYGAVKAFPGAVNLSLSAEGDEYIFRADNIDYFRTNSNLGYSGTFECARIPDEFATAILNRTVDTNNVEFEYERNATNPFALMFEVDGDENATKFVFYNVTVGRVGVDAQTTGEDLEVQTTTLDLTARPSVDLGIVRGRTRENTDATVLANWYTAVQLPA